MAITIPETEPLEFYSGETVKWKRTDLSDYPAPTWTLNYFLQKSGTKIDFASSQDGSTAHHLISLTPATTAGYTVGIYHWIVEATEEYKSDVDPTISWVETRHTGDDKDTVPTRLLYDDFMKYARENDIQLEPNFDPVRFGKTIMKKYKSKAKRIDGSMAKHYFGFKLPN